MIEITGMKNTVETGTIKTFLIFEVPLSQDGADFKAVGIGERHLSQESILDTHPLVLMKPAKNRGGLNQRQKERRDRNTDTGNREEQREAPR